MHSDSDKLAVVAVGGNSLISETEEVNVASEYKLVAETCRQIAKLIDDGWKVVITHGNGPQAGFNLRRCELAAHELFELPIDVIVTFTQGSIGYYIQQNLSNIFRENHTPKKVTTLVTQVEVDPQDPAFARPSKPIGSYLGPARIRQLEELGWPLGEEPGKGWRRLVASPLPKRIHEETIIRDLLEKDHVVVACGGGGVAVAPDRQGRLRGVAAIIDKDLSSALLAANLGAELLIISTAVERVALNFGQPEQVWLDLLNTQTAAQYLNEGHFGMGTMRPKIQAAINFIRQQGKRAIISSPDKIYTSISGAAGTHIVPWTQE